MRVRIPLLAVGVCADLGLARRADKETFEPIVEPLLALTHPDGAPVVREAWAFDMQSHGEAAGWNEAVLGAEGLCE